MEQISVIHALLEGETWTQAREQSDALIRDFARRLAIRGSDLMGRALVQRAIALEAEGRHREALWDAFAADALAVTARSLLAGYGAHGTALLDVLAEEPDEPELDVVAESGFGRIALSSAEEGDDAAPGTPEAMAVGGDVLAPVKLSGPDPQYPPSLRGSRGREFIILQVIVDKEGRPGQPDVVKGGARPVLLLNTLEAMKDWRFKPARLHGKPVDVYYTLTVNFSS